MILAKGKTDREIQKRKLEAESAEIVGENGEVKKVKLETWTSEQAKLEKVLSNGTWENSYEITFLFDYMFCL